MNFINDYINPYENGNTTRSIDAMIQLVFTHPGEFVKIDNLEDKDGKRPDITTYEAKNILSRMKQRLENEHSRIPYEVKYDGPNIYIKIENK